MDTSVKKNRKPAGKRKRVDDENEGVDVTQREQEEEPIKITEKVDRILRSTKKQKEKKQNGDVELGDSTSNGVPNVADNNIAAHAIQQEINLLLDHENADASGPEHAEAAEDMTSDQGLLREETSKAAATTTSKQAADAADAASKDDSLQHVKYARSKDDQDISLTQNDRAGATEDQADAPTATFSSSAWALRAARMKLLEEQAERLWQELVDLQRKGQKAM